MERTAAWLTEHGFGGLHVDSMLSETHHVRMVVTVEAMLTERARLATLLGSLTAAVRVEAAYDGETATLTMYLAAGASSFDEAIFECA